MEESIIALLCVVGKLNKIKRFIVLGIWMTVNNLLGHCKGGESDQDVENAGA